MDTIKTKLNFNVKRIKDRVPPLLDYVWVTDGAGNWCHARPYGDGTWNVRADFEDNILKSKTLGDFNFEYWAPILDEKETKIDSFKKWYEEKT